MVCCYPSIQPDQWPRTKSQWLSITDPHHDLILAIIVHRHDRWCCSLCAMMQFGQFWCDQLMLPSSCVAFWVQWCKGWVWFDMFSIVIHPNHLAMIGSNRFVKRSHQDSRIPHPETERISVGNPQSGILSHKSSARNLQPVCLESAQESYIGLSNLLSKAYCMSWTP